MRQCAGVCGSLLLVDAIRMIVILSEKDQRWLFHELLFVSLFTRAFRFDPSKIALKKNKRFSNDALLFFCQFFDLHRFIRFSSTETRPFRAVSIEERIGMVVGQFFTRLDCSRSEHAHPR